MYCKDNYANVKVASASKHFISVWERQKWALEGIKTPPCI